MIGINYQYLVFALNQKEFDQFVVQFCKRRKLTRNDVYSKIFEKGYPSDCYFPYSADLDKTGEKRLFCLGASFSYEHEIYDRAGIRPYTINGEINKRKIIDFEGKYYYYFRASTQENYPGHIMAECGLTITDLENDYKEAFGDCLPADFNWELHIGYRF